MADAKTKVLKNTTVMYPLESIHSFTTMLVPVYNRSHKYLVAIIQTYVIECSTVITDGWRGYTLLKETQFKQYGINHKENLRVYPEDEKGEIIGFHKNDIESTWRNDKLQLRARGTLASLYFSYFVSIR